MNKEKINFLGRIKHYVVYHPWLKVIALVLAVILWFYVKGEISRFSY
ncbi:MAG: hypothetical protein PHS09_00510 [Candidatus Omnitrophica bacterium]|nr:hypothetical protein [Candidatus Omnitrophota bacterium]MDD5512792.1 hypothetical protein [Candidatus Omnitrophota bacterium]